MSVLLFKSTIPWALAMDQALCQGPEDISMNNISPTLKDFTDEKQEHLKMTRKELIARKEHRTGNHRPLGGTAPKEQPPESWGLGRRSLSSEEEREGCSKKRNQHMQTSSKI